LTANLLAGLALIVIIFMAVLWFVRSRKPFVDWTTEIKSLLIRQGFTQTDQMTHQLAYRFDIINQRKSGESQVENVYYRPGRDYRLYVCDYYVADQSMAQSVWEWDWMVCLISPRLNLTRITIEAVPRIEGWMGSFIKSMFTFSPPPTMEKYLSDNPEFNQRYMLYSENGNNPSSVVSKEMIDLILNSGDINLDAEGDVLVLHSLDIISDKYRKRFNPDHINGLIILADRIFEVLIREETRNGD
jgi:hypothetical protein